jgi:hypothetical protein
MVERWWRERESEKIGWKSCGGNWWRAEEKNDVSKMDT